MERAIAAEQAARQRMAAASTRPDQQRLASWTRALGKAEPKRNITDPQSRMMPLRGVAAQGYSCQAVTSSDELIIATAVATTPVTPPRSPR